MSTKKLIIIFTILCLSLGITGVTVFSQPVQPGNRLEFSPPSKIHIPGLDSVLSQLVTVYESVDLEAAIEYAQRHGVTIYGDRVQVTAYATSEDPEAVNGIKAAIMERLPASQADWLTQ